MNIQVIRDWIVLAEDSIQVLYDVIDKLEISDKEKWVLKRDVTAVRTCVWKIEKETLL